MYDYRLFFANSTLDSTIPRQRRPLLGHIAERVVRLSSERREQRGRERR